jgi:hypothetical protein
MDHNVKLELAKQYLRERGKYILEQDKDDKARFTPSLSIETNVEKTMREYKYATERKQSEKANTQVVRLSDRKFRSQK